MIRDLIVIRLALSSATESADSPGVPHTESSPEISGYLHAPCARSFTFKSVVNPSGVGV